MSLTIAATADLHGHLPEIPDCDVFIIAGDITNTPEEIEAWLYGVNCEVIAISGNIEKQEMMKVAKRLPWTWADDARVEIGGYRFYGAPALRGMARRQVPKDTQVLITHVPPYGILDEVKPGTFIGSMPLRLALGSGRLPDLRLHVFGHVHEKAGQTIRRDGRIYANVGHLGRFAPQLFTLSYGSGVASSPSMA